MDTKVSQFPVISQITPEDSLFVITALGKNKLITTRTLANNLNKTSGVLEATGAVLPLTNAVVLLTTQTTPYTLPNGSDGQEIMLVGGIDNVEINFDSSYITAAHLMESSTLTVVFISALNKWVAKSYHNAVLI